MIKGLVQVWGKNITLEVIVKSCNCKVYYITHFCKLQFTHTHCVCVYTAVQCYDGDTPIPYV